MRFSGCKIVHAAKCGIKDKDRRLMSMFTHRGSKFTLWMLLAVPAFSADSVLVVDRGLPQANLNNVSGAARSNVRWSRDEAGFLGDDFTVGAPGEKWVIDSIRTWAVPGGAGATLAHLGDYYQDVRLHFGKGDLTPIASARLTPGSDETGNANIHVSDSNASGALLYDDFGTSLHVWQVDFTKLNLPVEGGVSYQFGVWGMGRLAGQEGTEFTWYNHASNAGLSQSRHDGADGRMLQFDQAGRFAGDFNAEGNGWDKPADINVQVFAHRVDSGEGSKRAAQQ